MSFTHDRHRFPVRVCVAGVDRDRIDYNSGVYVVAFDEIGAIKIGVASETNSRLRQLESSAKAGSCRAIMLLVGAGMIREKAIHKALSCYRYGKGRGVEWYAPTAGFFSSLMVAVSGEIAGHLVDGRLTKAAERAGCLRQLGKIAVATLEHECAKLARATEEGESGGWKR